MPLVAGFSVECKPTHSLTTTQISSLQNQATKSNEILMFVCLQKDVKQCCDATMTESIHTKDESKRRIAFAFIFGVN